MKSAALSALPLFVVAVLAASCGEPSSASPAPVATEAAAAAPTGSGSDPAILAASQTTPEAFVRALFSIYSDDAGNSERDNTGFYSARTAALRDEAIALNGYVDLDPILFAQDWDDFSVRSVTTTAAGADQAVVEAVVSNFGSDSTRRFSLVKEAGGWRIDDIATAEMPSLVSQIEAGNAAARQAAS